MKQLILPVIVGAILFIGGCSLGKYIYKQKESPMPKQMPKTSQLKLEKTYKDVEGNTHSVFLNQPVTNLRQENKSKVSSIVPYIDSLALGLNIKSNQIETVSSTSVEVKLDTIKFLSRQIDSLKNQVLFFKNKSVELTVRAGNPSDTLGNSSFDLKINTDLNYVDYYTRKNFLSSKYHHTDISSTDSFISIKGQKTISFVKKEPYFGLRVGTRLNYSNLTHQFTPGLYARFYSDRLWITGNIYYSVPDAKIYTGASIGYDLFNF